MKHIKKILSLILTILLLVSNSPMTKSLAQATSKVNLSGVAHIQNYGNRNGRMTYENDIETLVLGTRGMSKRLENVIINFKNNTGYNGSIEYQVHVQSIGWMPWVKNGQSAGTTGQSKRLEGIRIRLTGELAKHYDVRYATHIQLYGDSQGWVYNGALAGTTGESKRLEELKIQIIPKRTFNEEPSVSYRVHRQTYGWENVWARDGRVAGTTGQSKRLEAIEIRVSDNIYGGGIQYNTHIQSIGWQGYRADGDMSGTQGQSKRLEAIQINLTGNIANYYDVYYRVHSQNIGWMGWAKNGEKAGTAGYSYRLEAIQIKLVKKGGAAPYNNGNIPDKFKEKDMKPEPKPEPTTPEEPTTEEKTIEFRCYICSGFTKADMIEVSEGWYEWHCAKDGKPCGKKFYQEEYYIWKYGYYDENDPNMSLRAHAKYEMKNNKNGSHGGWKEYRDEKFPVK